MLMDALLDAFLSHSQISAIYFLESKMDFSLNSPSHPPLSTNISDIIPLKSEEKTLLNFCDGEPRTTVSELGRKN